MPVILMCVLCTLLEFIIRDNIMHFIATKLFSTKQYGFIKCKFTITQLLELWDKWTDWVEFGGQIDVSYTELEKAFNKVPHKF